MQNVTITVKSKQLLVFVYISQRRRPNGIVRELGFNALWASKLSKVVMLLKTKHMRSHCCFFGLGSKILTMISNFMSQPGFIEPIWNYGVLKKDEGNVQLFGVVWKKQKMPTSSKMQPLVIRCLLQATPFHLCHCEKERGGGRGEGSHFHLDHCLSLSVKGT